MRKRMTAGPWARRRLQVLIRDNWTCRYCCTQLGRGPYQATVDHVLPVERGGGDEMTNLVACCWPCQRRPATMLVGMSSDVSSGATVVVPRSDTFFQGEGGRKEAPPRYLHTQLQGDYSLGPQHRPRRRKTAQDDR